MRNLPHMALLLAACSFDPSTQGARLDADPNAADANAADADVNLDADLTVDADISPDALIDLFCGWTYNPKYFNPCTHPPITLPALSLTMADVGGDSYVYNTATDTFVDPQGDPVAHESDLLVGQRILWTSSFDIASVATLRVEGTFPLVIASKSTIDIDGVIDVGSYFSGSGFSGLSEGAGSESLTCLINPSGRGEDCTHGGAGGGGGGFSGAGGRGGNGAEGHNDCNNPDEFGDGNFESTGGAGGSAVSTPIFLRGGCAGQEGGEGDKDNDGIGAPGGGAVHLTAAAKLTVTGTIHAGGGGGLEANGDRSAGGGGGSGGMIGVEASIIDLAFGGVLSANGGGGGGGDGDNPGAFAGDDAPMDGTQAIGGAPSNGGTAGGDGGWLTTANGGSPATAPRGGGGGGGGAGYILYYQDSSPNVSATISPAAIAGP